MLGKMAFAHRDDIWHVLITDNINNIIAANSKVLIYCTSRLFSYTPDWHESSSFWNLQDRRSIVDLKKAFDKDTVHILSHTNGTYLGCYDCGVRRHQGYCGVYYFFIKCRAGH